MNKELSGVDLFKVIAAGGVVAIHCGVPFLQQLGRLGVPFFVIISSYFFFSHYFNLSNHTEKKKYLLKFEALCQILLIESK